MLLYRTIVMTAITDEVEPLLKKSIRQALVSELGPNWYHQKGIDVMQYYEDFEKIQKRIAQNVDPLDTMDLTALFFLLLPYSKDQTIDMGDGLLPNVANYLKMDIDYLRRKLRRLRDIRNNATHDDVDRNITPDNNYLENGTQEKKWLSEIETIMKHFQSSFQLASYFVKLNGLIEKRRNGNEETIDTAVYAALISETESIRRDCIKIHHLDFMDAPLVTPLTGPAPWATSKSDLDALPWPSQQKPEPKPMEKKPPQAPRQQTTLNASDTQDAMTEAVSQVVNHVFKKIDDKLDNVNDTAIDVIDRVSNGLDKLKRFLDKKK